MFNRGDDYLFEGYADGRSSPLVACLNAGWRTGIAGVTDEHGTDWGHPEGKGRTGLWVAEHTRAGVKAAMLARRFFATRTSGLRVDATASVGGAPAVPMGSELPMTRGDVTFTLDLARDAAWLGRPLQLQVLRPGTDVPEVVGRAGLHVGGLVTFTVPLDVADGDWVVLRVADPTAGQRHPRPRGPPRQRSSASPTPARSGWCPDPAPGRRQGAERTQTTCPGPANVSFGTIGGRAGARARPGRGPRRYHAGTNPRPR